MVAPRIHMHAQTQIRTDTNTDIDTYNCTSTRTDTVVEDHLRLPAHAKYTGVLEAASPCNFKLSHSTFLSLSPSFTFTGPTQFSLRRCHASYELCDYCLHCFLFYFTWLKNAKEQFKILDIFVNSLIYLFIYVTVMYAGISEGIQIPT